MPIVSRSRSSRPNGMTSGSTLVLSRMATFMLSTLIWQRIMLIIDACSCTWHFSLLCVWMQTWLQRQSKSSQGLSFSNHPKLTPRKAQEVQQTPSSHIPHHCGRLSLRQALAAHHLTVDSPSRKAIAAAQRRPSSWCQCGGQTRGQRPRVASPRLLPPSGTCASATWSCKSEGEVCSQPITIRNWWKRLQEKRQISVKILNLMVQNNRSGSLTVSTMPSSVCDVRSG